VTTSCDARFRREEKHFLFVAGAHRGHVGIPTLMSFLFKGFRRSTIRRGHGNVPADACGQGVVHVQIRPRIIRRVLIVVAVLLVSGAAAAMKLTSWTPANMCFCPTPDRPSSAAKAEGGLEALATSGNFKVPLDTDTTAHHAGAAMTGAAHVELAESSHGHSRDDEGGRPSWAPWGKHSNHRANSSSESAPSVKLGGFWKMMSLVGRAHHEAEASASAHVKVAATAHASAPKPSRPPVGGGSGGGSASGSATGPGAASPPAGSAFGEETTPVGQLASSGSSSAGASGALGAGSSGLGSARAGAGTSNLAATPEPASFALIATGLLGIAGLIRRRRV
jgi:PEP-CTERM motif-containing protein